MTDGVSLRVRVPVPAGVGSRVGECVRDAGVLVRDEVTVWLWDPVGDGVEEREVVIGGVADTLEDEDVEDVSVEVELLSGGVPGGMRVLLGVPNAVGESERERIM